MKASLIGSPSSARAYANLVTINSFATKRKMVSHQMFGPAARPRYRSVPGVACSGGVMLAPC